VRLAVWAIAFAVVGLLATFVVPKTYRASATILPPEDDDAAISLQQVRRGLTSLGGIGRLGSYFTQADIALAVLGSESVHATVARKFDLQHVYHARSVDAAVRELRRRSSVKIGSEGTITVTVEDGTPDRAAAMANSFMDLLDHFNQDIRSFRARRSRQFLVQRLAQEDSLLSASERLLVEYQKRHGTVVLSPEERGTISTAGSLMSRKVEAEVELELARQYASPTSEEVQRLGAQVRELNRQVGALPAQQLGGAGLVRDVTLEEQIVALLALQLEDARIREVMDTPTIQVLDRATPPEFPVWPRKSILVFLGGLLGLALGVLDAGNFRPRRSSRVP
jgi:uncharacterized protein involved in exopolysaccharide biosynthesis